MSLVDYTNAISFPGATKTTLSLPSGMDFDEWQAIGEKIIKCTQSCMWWLGDWWAYGDHNYGERAAQAVDIDLAPNTLSDAGWVASKIESTRRRVNLSWSHHREVAALEPDVQDELLSAAEKKGMSKRELRKAVRDYRAALNKLDPGPLPDGKYRIIYCDPPWRYNDERNLNGYDTNAASNSYPTMSLQELIDLQDPNGKSVTELAVDNCVLFLWATVPLQEDAHKLMGAWGFAYKTNIVWDKVKPGMGGLGHYTLTNHEQLLIGTQGPYIHVEEKFDSVQEIEKSGKHSKKPEEFRGIIDRMYPQTEVIDRIELFRRGDVPKGWHVWGNEIT